MVPRACFVHDRMRCDVRIADILLWNRCGTCVPVKACRRTSHRGSHALAACLHGLHEEIALQKIFWPHTSDLILVLAGQLILQP